MPRFAARLFAHLSWRYLAQLGLFCVIYILVAQIGLLFASTPGKISPVWPLSGIVVVVLLRFGLRFWPGVLLCDALVGLSLGFPAPVALGIACGTTMESLVGAAVLRRFLGVDPDMDRLYDVLGLVFISALLSTSLGAAVATLAVGLGGIIQGGDVVATWLTWWVGDAIGVLVFAPLLLTWIPRPSFSSRWAARLEALALLAVTAVLTALVFQQLVDYAYLLFPFLIWAALRGEQRLSTSVTLVVFVTTTWFTASGIGPFVRETVNVSLIFLQSFLGVFAVTGLVLSALITERRRATEARRLVADASMRFAQSLDYATTLQNIARLVTQTLADWCIIHIIEPEGVARCVALACADPLEEEAARRPYAAHVDLSAEDSNPLAEVLRGGRNIVLTRRDESGVMRKERAARAIMMVSLTARGQVIGSLVFDSAASTRRYRQDDLALAEEIARRAARAIEHARLYRTVQEALRQRDESLVLLDTLLSKIPIGFAFLDRELRYRKVNAALATIHGLSQEEHLGRSLDEVTPGFAVELTDLLQRVLTTGEPVINQELSGYHPSAPGQPVYLMVSCYEVVVYGQILGVAMIVFDITQHKQIEARLFQAHKMESIGRMAGSIAHDFNNMLTIISGCVSLAMESAPILAASYQELEQIKQTTNRAAGLTRQLLAFARRQPLEPLTVNLNDLIRDIEQILDRLLSQQVTVVMTLAQDLDLVKIDPVQFEQVLVNLAINGRDAMPEGGCLTIQTANTLLAEADVQELTDLLPGRYVILIVSDTGIGMDDQIRAQIFEPFFTTKAPGKGTGLGLATCYGIVKQSGGDITVASELEKGTTFTIYFPGIAPPGPISA